MYLDYSNNKYWTPHLITAAVCTCRFQFSLQLHLLSSRTFLLECSVREVRVAVATILEKTLDSALLYQEKVSECPLLSKHPLAWLSLVALALFVGRAGWADPGCSSSFLEWVNAHLFLPRRYLKHSGFLSNGQLFIFEIFFFFSQLKTLHQLLEVLLALLDKDVPENCKNCAQYFLLFNNFVQKVRNHYFLMAV